jgi:hypothetical protein
VLDVLKKLRKTAISLIMSVCPRGTTRLPLDGFSWNLTGFLKNRSNLQFKYKLTKIAGLTLRRAIPVVYVLTLSLLMYIMELLVKPEILASCVYIYICGLSLATLKAVSFYLLHSVSTLNQCRKFSCVTVVCKHFASYQDYPNYKWDLIW